MADPAPFRRATKFLVVSSRFQLRAASLPLWTNFQFLDSYLGTGSASSCARQKITSYTPKNVMYVMYASEMELWMTKQRRLSKKPWLVFVKTYGHAGTWPTELFWDWEKHEVPSCSLRLCWFVFFWSCQPQKCVHDIDLGLWMTKACSEIMSK